MEIAITVLSKVIQYAAILMIILYMFCIPKAIHIFQQESYQLKDYFRWIIKNPKLAFGNGFKKLIISLIYFALMFILDFFVYKSNWLNLEERGLIYCLQLTLFYAMFYIATIKLILQWKDERKNAKKKLVYTARVKRLIFFTFLATFFVKFSLGGDYTNFPDLECMCLFWAQYVWQYVIMILTMPIVVIIGDLLAFPLETIINDHYISSARWKIIRPKYGHLIRIGITGSYGKTSTKFILKTILSEKYNVLATPESYNTTMGNVKIIRKELKPEHEVFISEMGARYKGDIKKICDFVYPQIGIITSIGPQHLESFKTIERVADTKAELLRALPIAGQLNLANMYGKLSKKRVVDEGVIFLPSDGGHCSELFKNETKHKKISYGVNDKNANVYAKNIKMSSKGCEFTAVTQKGEIRCVSKLLGEHNIQNILGVIAIASYLGLSNEQIARGVSKIEPVEHRLQILPSTNGTIVIDDAFNSNPVGSKAALDVLKSFDGRKIIITPGMVELGEKEKEFNKEFGRHMAKCIDIAILVGIKRSKPIEEGLVEAGFDKMNIYVVSNLNEATKKLAELTRVGDVVLFENDLPDNYNE